MRKVISVVLVLIMFSACLMGQATLGQRLDKAVGLLYGQDETGTLNMRCTTTAFQRVDDGYLFVGAAHCIGEDEEGHSADASDTTFYITFDDPENKTFYHAVPVAVGYQHRGDDFCVFYVQTKDDLNIMPLGDEKLEIADADIINVASPYGLGKEVFHGKITKLVLDRPFRHSESGINWQGSMILDISAGGGSSGSAVVSVQQERIVGFLVGHIGSIVIAIPVSKFKAFLFAVATGHYPWYAQQFYVSDLHSHRGPAEVSFQYVQPKIALSRADVNAYVAVEPNTGNRGLNVALDGDDYYTSSYEALDGEDAPAKRQVWFKSVPEGHYTISAVLSRADGRTYRAQDTLCIGGPNVDCLGTP